MIVFMILPVIGSGSSRADARRPAYLAAWRVAGEITGYVMKDFGYEPVCIAVANLSVTQIATIEADPENLGFTYVHPENIDTDLSAADVTALQGPLGTINIPDDWIDTTFTHRTFLRRICGIFTYTQRYAGIVRVPINPTFRLFSNRNLNALFQTLPLEVRSGMISAAVSYQLPITIFVNGNRMRDMINEMGLLLQDRSYRVGGITL